MEFASRSYSAAIGELSTAMSNSALSQVDWFTPDDSTSLLILGDTHGAHDWMADVVVPFARERECATIIQVGDFGFVWDTDPVKVDLSLDRLHALLDGAGLTLLFLPGNHENHDMLKRLQGDAPRSPDGHFAMRPTIHYTGRISSWTWNGVRMAAVGGAVSIDRNLRTPGIDWWPEEQLRPEEVYQAERLGPVDILFTHDAPTALPMRLIPDLASAAHRMHMSQIGRALIPTLWFHGHYHETFTYRLQHRAGMSIVRSLGCHEAVDAEQSTAVLNLSQFRESLEKARYGAIGADS